MLVDNGGRAHKQKVHRATKDLQKAKLVEQRRDGDGGDEKKGEEEAAKTPEKNYMERPAARAVFQREIASNPYTRRYEIAPHNAVDN